MTFNPNAPQSSNYEAMPKGPTTARCSRIIEIGEQAGKYGSAKKVVIAFNVPSYTFKTKEGVEKQRMISNAFGISMKTGEKSTMNQYAKALDPAATSLGGFLNKTCIIQIGHRTSKKDGSIRDYVAAVTPILPGVQVPELDLEPFWFQWDNPDPKAWEMIPEFTKKLIREAVDYPGSKVELLDKQSPSEDTEDQW